MNWTAESIRADFPLLSRKRNGKPVIYLDSAATSLKPQVVLDAMNEYYTQHTANVHRGVHFLSQEASTVYEGAHEKVAKFVHAQKEEVSFSKNATESLNLIVHSMKEMNVLQKGDEIVLPRAEHHANLVPWQQVAKKTGAVIKWLDYLPDYTLNWKQVEQTISSKTKIVSVAHVHNTTGVRNDVVRLGKLAQKQGAYFFVDASQSVPHESFDFKSLNADAVAFSGHKMLGPTGIGVLVAKKKVLDGWPPFLFGGAMIERVTFESTTFAKSPDKFEAGTPPIAESYGLGAAIDYLNQLSMSKIAKHEEDITRYALEQLQTIKGVHVIGPLDAKKQGGTILFDANGLTCHEVALAVDQFSNVCIRSGMHCAQPFVESINKQGLCRASFYVYTTKSDVDALVAALRQAVAFA